MKSASLARLSAPDRSRWRRIAFLGALLVVVVMAVQTQRLTPRPPPLDQARADLRKQVLAELEAANTNLLNSYTWQNQAKGIVRVPLARALELVVEEWRNPTIARSNLIARAEQAASLPTTVPAPGASEPNTPTP